MNNQRAGSFLAILLVFLFMVGCVSFTPPEKRQTNTVNQKEQKESEQPKQLISNQARNVAIDQCNIWFATDKGVSRYDRVNKEWKTYTVKHGLVSNDVRAAAIDDNQVWFGTDNGISVYDYKEDKWKTYKEEDGLVNNEIYCITVDGKYVWIGTQGGLSRYDKEINSWATHKDNSGGRRDFGMVFSFGQVRFFRGSVPVTAIAVDGNYVWIGTYRGVLRYDKDKDSWSKYTKSDGLVDDKITAIAIDNDSVWFGTEDSGVSRYSKTEQAFVKSYTKRDLLASNNITSITVDGSYVWFGFANGGVQQYVRTVDTWRAFTKEDVLPSNHITTISTYGQEVWMGTYEDGIVRYDKRNDNWESYEEAETLIDNDVHEISVNEKYLWVATSRGLSRLDYHKKEWKNFKKADGLVENYITCVDSGSGGQVWIGTPEGLGALNDGSWKFYTLEDGLLDSFITSINLIEGQLYIGTKKGLSSAKTQDKELKFTDLWIPQKDHLDLFVNNVDKQDSLLWIATSNGLVKYDISNQEMKVLTESDGLPSNYVNTVKVWYGQVWAGTRSGLHIVKQNETFNLEVVKPLIKSLRQKNVRDFKFGDEAIWAGTPQGVVRYDLSTSDVTDYSFENTDGNLAHDNVKSIALTGSDVWFGTSAGLSKLDKSYAFSKNSRRNTTSSLSSRTSLTTETKKTEDDVRFIQKAWTKYTALDTVDVLHSSYVARIVNDEPYIWFGNWARSKNGAIGRYDKRTNTWNFFTRKNLPQSNRDSSQNRLSDEDRKSNRDSSQNRLSDEDRIKSNESTITRVRWIAVADDAVWFATNGGLLRYDKHFDTWRHYTTSDGIPNNDIHYVFVDKTNIAQEQESEEVKWQNGKMVKGQKGKETDKSLIGNFNPQSSIVNRQSVWLAHAGNVVSRYDPNTDEWMSHQIAESTAWGGVATIDADKRYVWFPTGNDGLRRYDKETGEWETIRKPDGLGSNETHDVLVDENYVWVTSWESLSRYNLNTGEWKVYDENTVIHGPTLWLDKGIDGVWILYERFMEYPGTKYNTKTDSWYSIESTEGHGSGASQVVETENDIWFATGWEGLHRYNKASKTWTVYQQGREEFGESGLPDRSLLVDNGKVWLGTQSGLLVYDIERDNWTKYRDAEPKLPSPRITALAADDEYLWCATSRGLSRYDKNKGRWRNFFAPFWGSRGPDEGAKRFWRGLISSIINSLTLDENYLWVGTKYGVSRYDLEADRWENYFEFNGLPKEEIRDLVVSGYDVWAATAEGVGQYNRLSDDPNAWKTYSAMSEIKASGESKEYMESLVHNDVRCLAASGKTIWFGTLEGVSRYDVDKTRWHTIELPSAEEVGQSEAKTGIYLASIQNNTSYRDKLVSCIDTDNKTVWFGTLHGLVKYETESEKYTRFTKEDGLASDLITCVEIDENEVWVGTASSGISRYNRESDKWQTYTAKETPLPHNRIHAIEIDGDSVWIGTENGLVRYSRQKDEWTLFESE